MIEKIFICGDIASKTQRIKLDNNLSKIIKEAKLSICNFEAPLYQDTQKEEIKAGPSIYNYPNAIKDLSDLGFDLFCLANNHIFDYGANGLKNTVQEIKKRSKSYIGATLTSNILECVHTRIIGNTKIAILNSGENQFGTLDAINRFKGVKEGYIHCFDPFFYQTLKNLKDKGEFDFIICIIHAGLEEVAVPLPQFRELYRYLCDLGADMIVGHHPHWAQGYEIYKDKYIFYSLGNFFFNLTNIGVDGENRWREAYSLLLSFKNGGFCGFEPIYHRLEESAILKLYDESEMSFSLDELNRKLESSLYDQEITGIIEEFYPIYLKYYDQIFTQCSSRLTLLQNIKMMIKKFLKRKSSQDALLLHNIQIETHRFLQELSLKSILKKSK